MAAMGGKQPEAGRIALVSMEKQGGHGGVAAADPQLPTSWKTPLGAEIPGKGHREQQPQTAFPPPFSSAQRQSRAECLF